MFSLFNTLLWANTTLLWTVRLVNIPYWFEVLSLLVFDEHSILPSCLLAPHHLTWTLFALTIRKIFAFLQHSILILMGALCCGVGGWGWRIQLFIYLFIIYHPPNFLIMVFDNCTTKTTVCGRICILTSM